MCSSKKKHVTQYTVRLTDMFFYWTKKLCGTEKEDVRLCIHIILNIVYGIRYFKQALAVFLHVEKRLSQLFTGLTSLRKLSKNSCLQDPSTNSTVTLKAERTAFIEYWTAARWILIRSIFNFNNWTQLNSEGHNLGRFHALRQKKNGPSSRKRRRLDEINASLK